MLDCPEWLYLRLVNDFNVGLINTYLDYSKIKPKIWLRINTLKVSISYVHKLFTKNKINYKINEYLDNFLEVDKLDNNNIILNNIKLGLLYVQNPSSAFVVKYLNPKPNSRILDACSAPGGKASFILQETSNSINLTCIEKNNSRLQMLKSNMKTLDFKNIKYINDDAGDIIMKDEFDQILLDLPCSSTGTFSKNPDIKWKIDNKSILFFKKIQLKILLNMSKFLKIGGELLYSTCSLLKNENEDNIIEFLKINRNFTIVDIQNSLPSTFKNKLGGMTVMPDSNNYEGMFAVKLKKNEENIS
jgi:16S rRNA (cytosine967-C5)-methyltransferase